MLYGRKGMLFHRIFTVLAVGAILMGLASTTFVWAAPGQSPAGQTIPTKTPVAPPTKEEKDKPTPTPTFRSPTPTLWVTPTAALAPIALPQMLPAAGARLPIVPLALAAGGALLVYVGLMMRRTSSN
jgi:hypothetical protein